MEGSFLLPVDAGQTTAPGSCYLFSFVIKVSSEVVQRVSLDDHSKLLTVQFYIHPFTHIYMIQCIY